MLRVRQVLPKDMFLALRVLRDGAASGELRIEADGKIMTVSVLDGVPAYASGWENFGRWLLRRNKLSLRDYVRLLNELGSEVASDTAFGEAVVRQRMLALEQVREAFTEFVSEQLVFGLGIAADNWSFTARERAELTLASGPVFVERLFLRAAETLPRDRIAEAIDFDDNPYPRLCDPAARIIHALSLTTPEARFLASIDGTRTSLELVSTPLSDGNDPAPLLATLIRTAFAEVRPHATPVVHSIPPASRVSRRPEPRGSMRARRRSVPPEMAEFTIAAPRVPSFIDVESESTASLGKVRRRLDRCDFAAALSELSQMTKLQTESGECATYQAWAEYRNNGNLAVSAARVSLKRRVHAALHQNAGFGFGHYVLAHIAKLEGDESAAERHLERASALEHDREADDGSYRILRSARTEVTLRPTFIRSSAPRSEAITEPPPGSARAS